ncbi:MAG: DUF3108 domain-containing protein [Pseudomonadota bacterium]|nr:DUF3108 domain-containing protein [Pseudomonadota bacterium]
MRSVPRAALSAALLLAASMTLPPAAISAELPRADLRYAVSINDTSLGEASLKYGARDGGFEAHMETFANAKALLFAGGNAATRMRYKVVNGKLLLLSSTEKSSGGERKVTVDWNKKQIKIPEKDPLPIKAGHGVENLPFPASLLLRPIDTIGGSKLQVVSPNRVRDFIYEKPVREIIETPAGKFDTWRLRKKRADGKPVTVTVWLTRDAKKIPVRMERLKRERLTKFLLIKTGA